MTIPEEIQSTYQNITTINPKDFGIRKKIGIFLATYKNDEEYMIFYITQKSRFLQKDVDKIEEIKTIILKNIENDKDIKKTIFITSPLCSKAKEKMEKLQWLIMI